MRDLDDVVLFVCGSAAKTILEGHPFDDSVEQIVLEAKALEDIRPELDAVGSKLDGIRVALLFSVLGGDLGSAVFSEVVARARSAGCKVVAVVGMPMRFEENRRGLAERTVRENIDLVDRLFIVDNQLVYGQYDHVNDLRAESFFKTYEYWMTFAMSTVASMLEGPFFSTFYAKSYTFSYVNAWNPGEAVAEAMSAALFPTDPGCGKLIVSVGSGLDGADKEQVFQSIVSKTGIMPDIVPRDDLEDNKMLLFLPVVLDSSPRASRS